MTQRPLTQTQADAITDDGTHWVSPSLYLQIKPNGARSWLFRYTASGKPHWMGCVPITVSVAANSPDHASPGTSCAIRKPAQSLRNASGLVSSQLYSAQAAVPTSM